MDGHRPDGSARCLRSAVSAYSPCRSSTTAACGDAHARPPRRLSDKGLEGRAEHRLPRKIYFTLPSMGCSGEPRPEPGDPIGSPLAACPTPTPGALTDPGWAI